jgi:hypothetical protein
MKPSVAITLIICGTVLVAVPYIHNAIATSHVTRIMVALQKDVNLSGDLPEYADALCMVAGLAMVCIGVLSQRKTQHINKHADR